MLTVWIAPAGAATVSEPLHLVVMDPLALQLSCTCVEGTGQRKYDKLALHLESFIGRPVRVTFDESLALARRRTEGRADLVIGKDAMVRHDAEKAGFSMRRIAALTDQRGETGVRGVFLVRADDPARSLADLAGRVIATGPVEEAESHGAARSALAERGVAAKFKDFGSLDAAAVALTDGESDSAVVSEFLPPLLEGCGKLDKGSTRILGATASVPFISVFVAATVDPVLEADLMRALKAVADQPDLLAAMESRSGFVAEPADTGDVMAWTDWRGPGRSGTVPQIPSVLPAQLPLIWSAPLTGPAMAGVAATATHVVVPDKSADFKRDVFLCLSAADGSILWRLEYEAAEEMDYSNAPRATPVIRDGLVYLQGALGHLHCVELATGLVVWKVNVFSDFGTEPITWGCAIPPLIVDDKLIIAPGAKDASVVALDRHTGRVVWKTPGHAAAYGAFIEGAFDGVRQIVGFDVAGIGGWDPVSGRRLWEVIPTDGADFNVTTPIRLGDRLLLTGENNATRLHSFDGAGVLNPEPVLRNEDMAPDTCTPVVAAGRIFATAYGELFCLDAATLKTIWRKADDMFHDHSTVVAGRDRVLVWTMSGDLLLIDATANEYKVVAQVRPFAAKHLDTMSHPAFVGDRIYLRSRDALQAHRLVEK